MTGVAAPTVGAFDLAESEWLEQGLLVLTDGRCRGRSALALSFREAVLVDCDAERDIGAIKGQFRTVAIELSTLDLDRVARLTDAVVPALRPGGRVVVLLDPDADIAAGPGDREFGGLAWEGLATLDGRLGAVLRAGATSTTPVAAMLATAMTAQRLASADAEGERARRMLVRHVDARRASEDALLRHLETLVAQLELERREHQGRALARTVLRRSAAGRALLRGLRLLRRLTGRLRRGVRGPGRPGR
jgi:hypothetical protein